MCCIVKWCVGCGLRIVLIIINLPILISGLGLLATGIVLSSMGSRLVSAEEQAMVTGVAILITVGSILTVIGFAGVCGAFCNTDILIKVYALIQIFTFLLAACMLVAVPIVANGLDDTWYNEINNLYGVPGQEEVTERWDALQSTLLCCGVYSYQDWNTTYFSKNYSKIVPKSCCIDNEFATNAIQQCYDEATNKVENATYLLTKPCYEVVETFEAVMIGFLSSTLGFLVINAIVAFCLLKMNKDE